MTRHSAAAALAAILLLTACGGTDDGADGTSTEDVTESEDTATEPPEGTPEDGPGPPNGEDAVDGEPTASDGAAGSDALLGPEVQAAIDDVVERTGVAREDVLVTVTELVTWPDGSLGCPEPDTMYTQALVDGYRIVLEVDGEAFAYHGVNGQGSSDPLFCTDPQPPTE